MSINEEVFDWEITFKIHYTKLSNDFSINGIDFVTSKDEEYVTLVKVKVSTSNFNLLDAKIAASKKANVLLDAYSLLFGRNLPIEYVDYDSLKVPKLSPGTELLMPSTANTPIIIYIPISREEFNECQNFSNKIKTRRDVQIFEKIISWYRKGLESRDEYDRFLYAWIAFNALYSHFSIKKGDVEGISNLMQKFLKIKKAEPIFLNNSNDFIALSKANIKSKSGKTNYSKELEKSISNKDYESAIKYGIRCVYGVRCDLFHGAETLSINSRKLVESAYRILDDILRNCVLVCV